jgi:lanosterol synthase
MTASPALDSLSPALTRLATLQQPNGCWEGEVVWCPMILAQYIIVQSIVGREIEPAERSGMIQHFRVTRIDGMGWGLHQESAPYVFVTTLAYVALRLLGVRAGAKMASFPGRHVDSYLGQVLALSDRPL